MSDAHRRVYLDADVWIGWLQGEVSNGVDRGEVAEFLIGLAHRDQLDIVVSAFVLVEVRKAPPGKPDDEAAGELILESFEREFISVVPLTRDIAADAQRLARKHRLNSGDAVHLATARTAGCDALFTFDEDFRKIVEPEIVIEAPHRFGQAPFP
ncbi:MAG: type II toxin-antitoxin system VapC family toxin [Dehalococcoidia bacterium]